MNLVGFATLLVAITASWLATPWVVRLAERIGAVDHPNRRKMHERPIPRIGGVAVFIGFVAALAYAALVTGNLFVVPSAGMVWRSVGIAATGLFLVGLADDLWQLSFRWKLIAQLAAAVYIWSAGFRIESISHPFGGDLNLGWLALPATVLWIVAITNAVNLIDGLDGLAAGTGVIMTGATAAIAYVRGDLGVTAAAVALCGSLLGFLWFNFNPARIFGSTSTRPASSSETRARCSSGSCWRWPASAVTRRARPSSRSSCRCCCSACRCSTPAWRWPGACVVSARAAARRNVPWASCSATSITSSCPTGSTSTTG
jgi:hypothetical protein